MEPYYYHTNLAVVGTRVPLTSQHGADLDVLYDGQQRQRVLVIDDDADTVFLLKEILRAEGFDVYGALDSNEALRKVTDFPPHLILLDLMMPDHDGWETFESLRKVTTAPVIVVSARDNKDDIVKGLSLGIDDYLTKPFFNAEVVARVKTVLRRARPGTTMQRMVFPDVDLVIDAENQEVSLRGNVVHLTPREYAVLLTLARRAPRSVSNQAIARDVWGEDSPSARKRIKYLVYLLRKKVEREPAEPELILNNEAYGYRLQVAPPEAK